MRPLYHFVASLALGVIIWLVSQSVSAGLIALLAGVFIDLDHLIDFWSLKPARPFSPLDFLRMEKYEAQKKYIFIFFHGYEWLAALWITAYYFNWPLLLIALASTLSLHLFLDSINLWFIEPKEHPLSYFFFFRAGRGFKKRRYWRK